MEDRCRKQRRPTWKGHTPSPVLASLAFCCVHTRDRNDRNLFHDVSAWEFKNDRFHIYNLKGKPLNDAAVITYEEGRKEREWKGESWLEMRNTFSAALQSRVWAWGVGVKQTLSGVSVCIRVCVCVTVIWYVCVRRVATCSQTDGAEPPSFGNFTHSKRITKSRELQSPNTHTENLSWQFPNPYTVWGGRDFTESGFRAIIIWRIKM